MTTHYRIQTSHAEIAVADSGASGVPIVMLHGSGSSSTAFAGQYTGPLGRLHRVLALDLPGHGDSTDALDAARSYGVTGFAQACNEVLDALGIETAVLFGWSMGGHIAIEMLARRPERIAGLMISGTPPIGPGLVAMLRGFRPSWDMLLASKAEFGVRDVERFGRLIFGESPTPAERAGILRQDPRVRGTFSRSLLRGEGADQRRTVETATVPVAMVNGAEDPLVRASYVENLAYANLWEGHCHFIAGARHAPFIEAPAQFDALLHRFAEDVTIPFRRREVAAEPVIAYAASA